MGNSVEVDLSLRHLQAELAGVDVRLRPVIAKLRATAEARQGAVCKFGVAGLFIFVFMPFWMTAILAPRFLASAFAAGPALLILLAFVVLLFSGCMFLMQRGIGIRE